MIETKFLFSLLLLVLGLPMSYLPEHCQACDAATYIRLMKEQEKARQEIPKKLKEKDLLLLHSEGLSGSMQRAAKVFTREHEGYRVFLESAASTEQTSSTSISADIIALTDSWPIRELLMPDSASFYVNFARDEMVLAYGGEGRNYSLLRDASWQQILSCEKLRFGYSDPRYDDCGVRTRLSLLLAQNEGIKVPKREKEHRYKDVTKLVGAILHDEVDYALIYRSVAQYHNMLISEVPSSISLGSAEKAKDYESVELTIDRIAGDRPSIKRRGSPITCAFAILRSASHRRAARLFAQFLLGKRGSSALKRSGLEPIKGGRVAFSKETSIY